LNDEKLNYRSKLRLSNKSILKNGSNQNHDSRLRNEQVQPNKEKDQLI